MCPCNTNSTWHPVHATQMQAHSPGYSLRTNLQWKTHTPRFFQLPQGWAVVGEDDQFRFALSDHFQSLFVPQHVLSTFHNQLEPRVDRLQWLFRLLCGHHLPALDAGLPQPRAATKMDGGRERKLIVFNCICKEPALQFPRKRKKFFILTNFLWFYRISCPS